MTGFLTSGSVSCCLFSTFFVISFALGSVMREQGLRTVIEPAPSQLYGGGWFHRHEPDEGGEVLMC